MFSQTGSWRILSISLIFLLADGLPSARAQQSDHDTTVPGEAPLSTKGPRYVPGELIVRFHAPSTISANGITPPSTTADSIQRLASLVSTGTKITSLGQETTLSAAAADSDLFARTYRLSGLNDIDLATEVLRGDPSIEHVQRNFIYHSSTLPNDSYIDPQGSGSWTRGALSSSQTFSDMWGLEILDATSAWSDPSCPTAGCRGAGVAVAVIDTGVDYKHPDIAANIYRNAGEIAGNRIDDDGNGKVDDVRGWDFIEADNTPLDLNGHGTHVAGTIAAVANNGIGIAGVAPSSKIIPVRALDEYGGGNSADLAAAIRYAALEGAKVINNSWGCSDCEEDELVRNAILYASSKGVVTVFAAGNDTVDASAQPYQADSNVVVVGAAVPDLEPAAFSNFGYNLAVSAPGAGPGGGLMMLSLLASESLMTRRQPNLIVGGSYLRLAGTSMAAPHVTGVAALLRGRFPTWTPADIKSALKISSRKMIDPVIGNRYYGQGLVDALYAIKLTAAPPHAILESAVFNAATGRITVSGSAGVRPFKKYELYMTRNQSYAPSHNDWQLLKSSTISVNRGVLFDGQMTGVIPEGKLILKLVVTAPIGSTVEDMRDVQIGSQVGEILSPNNGEVLSMQERASVQGSIKIPFASYEIEFTEEGGPPWITTGVTKSVTGPGLGLNGLLATLNPLLVNQAHLGRVFVRLTVTTSTYTFQSLPREISFSASQRRGFPIHLPVQWEATPPEFTTVDLNRDGTKEILVSYGPNDSDMGPVLTAIASDGKPLWVRNLLGRNDYNTPLYSPVVAELDGDPYPELIVTEQPLLPYSYASKSQNIVVLNHLGEPGQSGWPVSIESGRTVQWAPIGALMAADLDRDGKDEIITKERTIGPDERTITAEKMVIRSSNGSTLVTVPMPPDKFVAIPYSRYLAVGNFDDDRDLEIVVKSGPSEISIYNRDGTPFPAKFSQSADALPGVRGFTVGDIDNDGYDEIVIIQSSLVSATAPQQLIVLDRSLKPLPGFPKLFPDFYLTQPSIADLNEDGLLEIIFTANRHMHVIDSKGSNFTNWPRSLVAFASGSPSVADINGDGSLELLVVKRPPDYDLEVTGYSWNAGISAYNLQGQEIDLEPTKPGSQLYMQSEIWHSPLIDDLDNNGKTDIVNLSVYTSFTQSLKRHSLYSWEFPGKLRAPWNQNYANSRRNGRVDLQNFPGDVDGSSCVTVADRTIVSANLGRTSDVKFSNGDVTYDGKIAQADVDLVVRMLGRCRGQGMKLLPVPTITPTVTSTPTSTPSSTPTGAATPAPTAVATPVAAVTAAPSETAIASPTTQGPTGTQKSVVQELASSLDRLKLLVKGLKVSRNSAQKVIRHSIKAELNNVVRLQRLLTGEQSVKIELRNQIQGGIRGTKKAVTRLLKEKETGAFKQSKRAALTEIARIRVMTK